MNTTVFSAYNESSKRRLASGITTVDSINEPIKVLKILMEGLTPTAGAGVWIARFHGLPIARSYSPFDLVYLDDEYRVVHHVEITQDSSFVPFKGLPTSALVLPAGTIVSSRIFTRDRIAFRADENAAPQLEPTQLPPLAAKVGITPAGNATDAATRRVNITFEHVQGPATPVSTQPDAVLRPAKRPPGLAPNVEPSIAAAAGNSAASAPAANISNLVASTTADFDQETSAPNSQEPIANEPDPSAPTVFEPVAADPSASVSEAPVSQDPDLVGLSDAPVEDKDVVAIESDEIPLANGEASAVPLYEPKETQSEFPAATDTGTTNEAPLGEPIPGEALQAVSSSDIPAGDPEVQTGEIDNQRKREAMDLVKRWDVQLLYSLFPELHPSYRPELQMPSIDPLKQVMSEEDGKLSKKIQLLSWLYPELELETVEKRQREHRRAPRIPNPGLVGYFYSSGKAEPHEIRNFSITGFYMKTDERWLPGTVIRVTLQMVDTDGSNPEDSLTLHSRVVNWDEQGGGFEFVLPGFLE